MDTNKKIREHLSALSDGELPDADLELALAAMHGADGRQAWDLYHHIGDVLRAPDAPGLSPGFAQRLAARLAAEALPSHRAMTASEAEPAPAAVMSDPESS
ncbi:sigma-E factor negative regulatory protein [Massilia niastensis]|uniref:sigma-E factor negative regulatory protein n=1 Tax=Massilia niastensis TaxID=544911 RepID=UPI0003740064|nr:sigma-E factor negative regulatory protein [Massilia niastensis]